MPDRRAGGRLRGAARRLPAVLLSGIFVLVTAGLPASAAATYTRELTAGTNTQESGETALTTAAQLPDVVTPAASLGTEPGLLPPASGYSIASPLDQYMLGGSPCADAAFIQTTPDTTHQDRAPPVAGQQ